MGDESKEVVRIVVIIMLMAIGLTAFVTWLIKLVTSCVQDDLSTETVASTEIFTEAIKVSEIATESIDDDTTDAYYKGERLHYTKAYNVTEDRLSPATRMVYFQHRAEIWYSVKEKLGYTTKWNIPGKHVAEDGTIRDKDGYVCIAMKDMPQGHTTLTSMGIGKVYDTWESNKSIGIYTDWREEK